ncbi:MAG TPA: sigma-70 family RNA polymerase sigma factor [Leptolinea sp.]
MSSVRETTILDKVSSDQTAEAELVRRAQKNPDQFGRLYDRYIQRIYRFLLARTADPAEAEDLTSQTFLTAVEKISEYSPNDHFGAWLFRIAFNKHIDLFRKKKRHEDVELDESLSLHDGDILKQIIHNERQSILRQKMSELPENERELIHLRLVAQMSFAEMGAYLHLNSEAIKKKYYRLIQRLREEMDVDHG